MNRDKMKEINQKVTNFCTNCLRKTLELFDLEFKYIT